VNRTHPKEKEEFTMQSNVYRHAIVIGSSIAGLTAARMLTHHFEQVTIIERDRLPENADYRQGVPQARHAHALTVRGQQNLEEMFPGLLKEMVEAGAHRINVGNEFELNIFGAWRAPVFESTLVTTACSRPLIENMIYRRISALPQVRILQEHEATGICVDEARTRILGVRVSDRADKSAAEFEMTADLVVDASGRNSKAPEWLAGFGFPTPHESIVNAHPGYASRLYRLPANSKEPWKAMYMMPEAPHQPRGAVMLPMEGDRWQVTLIGMDGDYPPTDEEGFLAFARSLPSPRFYDALVRAEPLTAPVGFRKAENRLRHYDTLLRYLEGFLLCGDSVYALNPVYGQGMTVATLGAQALDRALTQQRKRHGEGNLTGLAAAFQKELGKVAVGPWQMATGQDRRWRSVEGVGELDRVTQMIQGYFDSVQRVMMHNPHVAEGFFHVMQMMAEPTLLFRPDILVQVLIGSWKLRSHSQKKVTAPHPVAVAH
jgi:2-polyprenyl-6-methoxyphenol hydroxylase-like FAD-dependent oxidoreductase